MAGDTINFAPPEVQILVHELTSVNLAMICAEYNLSAVSAHMLVLSYLVEGLTMVDAKATSKMLRAMAQAYSPTSTDKEKAKADEAIIAIVNHFHNLADLYQAKTGGTA